MSSRNPIQGEGVAINTKTPAQVGVSGLTPRPYMVFFPVSEKSVV